MAIIKFKKKENRIFQFRIDIKGAKPPIWRRVQVRDDITFEELHLLIQNCFNWLNYHMHHFYIKDNSYIVDMKNESYESDFLGTEDYDELEIKLKEMFKIEGQQISYRYDFGDNWEHVIKLEKILDEKKGKNKPRLITGKRFAPYEDCGGIWGWETICEVIKDKNHPEREEILEICGDFDPNNFGEEDIMDINERLEDWERCKKDTREGVY